MPVRCRHILRLLLPLLLVAVATASASAANADNTQQKAQTRHKLEKVKQKIDALARQQRETHGKRDAVRDKLAAQADKLSAAATAVHQADQALKANQDKLDALQDKRNTLKSHLHSQRKALADLLRAAYRLRPHSDLRLLLGHDDVARLSRALTYSRYFQHDRIRRIHDLLDDLADLREVNQRIKASREKLARARARRKQHAGELEQARAAQKQLLAQVKGKLDAQDKHMQQLQANRESLQELLRKLRNAIADIPDKLPSDTPFKQRRGELPWPVHGHADKRGAGVDITADQGRDVHAVAHGRVVYADWLRGYGELLILDHGNGWMSLYGHNESLRRDVGDWVDAGDVVATVGTGTDGASGVYFGLRHDGKAVNPLPWLVDRD